MRKIIDWLDDNTWFLQRAWRWLSNLPNEVKWFFQRGRLGWSATDSWSGYLYLAKVNHGIIQAIRMANQYNGWGYPMELKNAKQWEKILEKMEYPFKFILDKENDLRRKDWKMTVSEKKKYDEGMKLFAKYFEHLWW